MTRDLENLVSGRFTAEAQHGTIDVLNPADLTSLVARVPAMGADDIVSALVGADAARDEWRLRGPLGRAEVLAGAAALLRERSAGIAADLVAEMGKTTAEATGEVLKAADFFEYYAGIARSAQGYLLADVRPGAEVQVVYEPVGVVVCITPWNDPLLTPARKVAPALACGNTVVLKPSTETPVVSWHLARALHDAGVPAGVFTTVTGRSAEIMPALLADPRVAAVTFTGSTEVGLDIQRRLAGTNMRVQTEMGGKNASVVLSDADLALASSTIVQAAFAQAGQRCTATSRLIVDRSVADDLIRRVTELVAQLRIGAGGDGDTTLSPVVNRAQRDAVLAGVETARQEGATVVTGGGIPDRPELADGCFVEPTIISHVRRDMSVWREELFGPVLAVHVVDGFDEAIDAVNDSEYGLSAAVFTNSLDHAAGFRARADVGQLAVNLPTSGWDVHHPFGGFALSGSAFKEQGVEGLSFYRRVKTCAVRTST